MPRPGYAKGILPGVLLSAAIGLLSAGFEWVEVRLFGYAYLDGLVVAILLGTLLHTAFGLDKRFVAGVKFSAKIVLEVAIVLLGGTISAAAIASSGLPLIATVVGVVTITLFLSYGIGRLLGLDDKLATLVSCGNSICGNSAIMAAAPAIDARSEDVAAAIGFTAVLGITVVLFLPLSIPLLGLDHWQYGVVAGLSVYAVPQVLAATVPVSMLSAQIGTIVKLVRVLMLGPVVLAIGIRYGRRGGARLPLSVLVPWFIVGFLVLMLARSFGFLPDAIIGPLNLVSYKLTLIAMAALGLSVNLRSVLASGGKVLAAGALSIVILIAMAIVAVSFLPIT
ncbi:putative sulfate exporter family transporter [Bosea sp. (in: a-proteobacteria)]|uniref:YeiH family protein n=1 Tax=Bosea sp. (in: a-proteobacteria) TaxID=1871050 RepID=UPI00260B32B6|nr:putative sulfate exporter family transporter [Bosea sp. (in: a-proteobacteria)]MCO5091254.1 putative sulfate exporter family transporter [Bosea sp. (in: a-proteobacteria)]